MSKNQEKYRVTSPIKRGGKRYEVGESILLTVEQAEGLHVEEWNTAESEGGSSNQPQQSPSMGLNAENAIAVIEGTDLKGLTGFVLPEPEGTENRKTVLKAWQDKQSADKTDTPEKGSKKAD